MTPELTDDNCTRCGHSLEHHRYRDSGDERPGACQYAAGGDDGSSVCDCPAYTPRVDPLPSAALDFDTSDEQ